LAFVLVGCAGVALVAVGWLGVRALLARAQLEQARAQITTLQRELLGGDVPDQAELSAAVASIGERTASARALTGDPVWSAAGHLPVFGCPLRAVRSLVLAADGVAADGLPSVAAAGRALDPTTLRTGMTIALPELVRAQEPTRRAAAAVQRFRTALAEVPDCGAVGTPLRLGPARDAAATQAGRLGRALNGLELATRLGPSMLGADGPRRYLLIVQNPAESRANGGIIGGYGLLTANNGELALESISGNGTLPQKPPDTQLPADLVGRYGPFQPNHIWGNANLTPDYPTAARFYSALYASGTGVSVDGTLSLDPTTLSYLLRATRPARLPDGRVVTADSLVPLVASQIYAQIPDVNARDAYFAAVGKAVYESVSSGAGNTQALLTALGRAAGEGRIQVSSNHADEERTLSVTPVGGALPTARGAFLGVITQNAAASKLDYWMRRSVDYRMARRPDGSGIATITVHLLNAAPDGLPEYVRYRLDRGGPGGNQDAQNQVWLSVYTGVGSLLLDATLDGTPTTMALDQERGHPVASAFLPLDRGRPRTLVLRVWEPVGGPALTVRSQPLVAAEHLTVDGLPARPPWSLDAGN
jgi:hypothetical protein